MDKHQLNWQRLPQPSRPHGLETEHRLTKLEVRYEVHEKRHDQQDSWNKVFTISLLGLGSGLAHAKVPEIIEIILRFWKL